MKGIAVCSDGESSLKKELARMESNKKMHKNAVKGVERILKQVFVSKILKKKRR